MRSSYAAEALALPLPAHARHRLLDAYLDLSPFPDAEPTLAALAPRRRLILSNGTHAMLAPLAAATGLARHLDAILSVDDAGVYKPSPRVYQLAVDALEVVRRSASALCRRTRWDAIGAKAFGFTVFWINRAGAPLDRHGPAPDCMIRTLADLPALLTAA